MLFNRMIPHKSYQLSGIAWLLSGCGVIQKFRSESRCIRDFKYSWSYVLGYRHDTIYYKKVLNGGLKYPTIDVIVSNVSDNTLMNPNLKLHKPPVALASPSINILNG